MYYNKCTTIHNFSTIMPEMGSA